MPHVDYESIFVPVTVTSRSQSLQEFRPFSAVRASFKQCLGGGWVKHEGQDVAICGGGRGQAELEMAALQKSVGQCLGLALSRWGRTGRAGPGWPWQPGSLCSGAVEGAGLEPWQHLT